MDFTLDDEQRALREAVRDMLADRVSEDEVGPPEHDPDLWKALALLGALELPYDDEAGPVEVMLIEEELGRAGARTAYAEMLEAGLLLAAAGESDLLEQVGEGAALVVTAAHEPGRGRGSSSTLEIGGEGGEVSLSGTLDPVPFAAAATHVVVVVGDQAFLVEEPPVSGSGITLDDTPALRLDLDAGEVVAAANQSAVARCAEALGAMQAALDLTVDYLKTRKQFGVPLASFQTLTQRAADMYVELELARSTVQFAAMTMAADPSDTEAVSRCKVVLGKAARLIGQEAIQLHGGIGMTAEYAVGHRTARLTAIERTDGDTRTHLGRLAATIADHETVQVL